MITYRIVRQKYADLAGEGARLYGGRFNPIGIPAVYSSQSISLSLLEILVHILLCPQNTLRLPTPCNSLSSGDTSTAAPSFAPPPSSSRENPTTILFAQAPDFQAEVDWIEPLNFDQRLFSLQ